MARRVMCDFTTKAGWRVTLDRFPNGNPFATLRVGNQRNKVIIDVAQAVELRDGLNQFLLEVAGVEL